MRMYYHSMKRFAVATGIFIVLTWCASLYCYVSYIYAASPWAWNIGFSSGVLYFGFVDNSSGWMNRSDGWNFYIPAEWQWYGFGLPTFRPFHAAIPMWVLLLIVAELTLFHYWRRRPPSVDGLCDACQYDLRGNVSGICPECGTVIAHETRRQLILKEKHLA